MRSGDCGARRVEHSASYSSAAGLGRGSNREGKDDATEYGFHLPSPPRRFGTTQTSSTGASPRFSMAQTPPGSQNTSPDFRVSTSFRPSEQVTFNRRSVTGTTTDGSLLAGAVRS